MLGGALLFVFLASSLNQALKVGDKELDDDILRDILKTLEEEEEEKEVKKNNEEQRIIGGSQLKEGDHPWLVSLEGDFSKKFLGITYSKKTLHCGGSLIKRKWVLTAAHCFVNDKIGSKAKEAKYWTARLGEIERESGMWDTLADIAGSVFGRDDWKTWEITGEKIIIHSGYTGKDYWKHDIALLKLEEEVPLTEALVGEVRLPAQGDSDYPKSGDMCVAMGWGCKKHGGQVADYAQKVELMALSNILCKIYWSKASFDTRLCAGEAEQHKGVCSGDSGGPLMCKNHDRWYQAGVTSFASADAPGEFPGVFTRVSSYVNWINQNTNDN